MNHVEAIAHMSLSPANYVTGESGICWRMRNNHFERLEYSESLPFPKYFIFVASSIDQFSTTERYREGFHGWTQDLEIFNP